MDFKPFKIGKYLLLERLATGGMAEVYRAKASGAGGFEKQLAIKRILPSYSQNEEFRRMFEYEARLSSMLTHANIVQVYDFTKAGETYLLAMEYVDGKNLRQFVNKTRKSNISFPVEFCVYVLNEVCKGLEYAHNKKDDLNGKPLNIIHRDMSPQNIMLSYEGAVKIVDFGIAKAKDRVDETRSGVIKGKFGYMSPEQANGEQVDHRTDIFSTGIILFELLTGKRLFAAESDMATLKQIQECVIPTPSRLNPKVTAELEKIMLKALTKDLKLRYQDAGVFHRSLLEFLNKHYPTYTQREVSETLQKAFKEEIETEKKRFEQIYRQSIPFSQQNSSQREVPDDLGSIEDALEGSMTRSEVGSKTSVTSADGEVDGSLEIAAPTPKANESSVSSASRPDATQVSLSMPESMRLEDEVSAGGDTQFDAISIEPATGELTLDKIPLATPPKAKANSTSLPALEEKEEMTQGSLPAPGDEFAMPKVDAKGPQPSGVSELLIRNSEDTNPPEPREVSTSVDKPPRKKPARPRDRSVSSNSEVSKSSPTPELRPLDLGTFDNSLPSLATPTNGKSSRRRRRRETEPDPEPRPDREDYDFGRPARSRRLFHPALSLLLFAGVTGYLYHLFFEGQVPTLIEMIQPRQPTNSNPALPRSSAPSSSSPATSAPPRTAPDKLVPSSPAAANCTIQVSSDPSGANVLIGRETRGLTPATISGPCNQAIDVTLSLDGYEPVSENRLLKNSVEKMYKTMKKTPTGRVELTVNQNAKVFIDGNYAGDASPKVPFEKNLRAGRRYRIRLVNEIFGAETTEEVLVAEDVVIRRTIRLQEKRRAASTPSTPQKKKRRK